MPPEPVPIKDLEIKYSDLEFKEKDKIGTGGSGAVYRGKYRFNPVAVKKLHATSLSAAALKNLKKKRVLWHRCVRILLSSCVASVRERPISAW